MNRKNIRSFLKETDDDDLALLGSRFVRLADDDEDRHFHRPQRDPERRHVRDSQRKGKRRPKLH